MMLLSYKNSDDLEHEREKLRHAWKASRLPV